MHPGKFSWLPSALGLQLLPSRRVSRVLKVREMNRFTALRVFLLAVSVACGFHRLLLASQIAYLMKSWLLLLDAEQCQQDMQGVEYTNSYSILRLTCYSRRGRSGPEGRRPNMR
jgi:hypothetical protein